MRKTSLLLQLLLNSYLDRKGTRTGLCDCSGWLRHHNIISKYEESFLDNYVASSPFLILYDGDNTKGFFWELELPHENSKRALFLKHCIAYEKEKEN